MVRAMWLGAVLICAWAATEARATWSILIADERTGEIVLGSATCVTRINLQHDTPVLRVGIGAATAQSFVDVSGENRQLIWDELALGTAPDQILVRLRQNEGRRNHNSRQYGIVDVRGRAATFSGNRNGSFAGGRTGRIGTLVYAVQGNVITGMELVDGAADAIEQTPGDLPEKLMAAMEAAYCYGGDGRCSCDDLFADGCGSPPEGFVCEGDLTANPKTAHVGYLIAARRGDLNGDCEPQMGCASGTYFLEKNVRNTVESDPDPVFTLRERFDQWRDNRRGEPDQVQSRVTLSAARALPGAARGITMRIELRDWEGQPPTDFEDIEVLADPEHGTGSTLIGALAAVDPVNHIYEVPLTSGDVIGLDRIAVRVTYGGGQQRYLMPGGVLAVQDPRGDFNADGQVDLADLGILTGNFGALDGDGDFDGNGVTDLSDLAAMLVTPGLTLVP